MNILDSILQYIGIAGVVIIFIVFIGYGILCFLTHGLEYTETDNPYPGGDPNPGEPKMVAKIPITFKVIGIFFVSVLFYCSNLYFCK